MTIDITRAINYEKAHIVYKVKITNPNPYPLAKVEVKPYITSDLFILDKDRDKIDLLEIGDSRTVTFKLRPKGECGNVAIRANVDYYDTKKMRNFQTEAPPIDTAIVCPMLRPIQITEPDFDRKIGEMVSVQEKTRDVAMGKDELFEMVTDVMKDMNMYPIPPKRGSRRNVGKFYCQSPAGEGYAVKAEVIGGERKSKLLIKTYAQNQASLVGCYYKILDEIDDRTNIKQYIDDKVVIKHYHGDVVTGSKVDIRDSVVQRSQVGVSSRTSHNTYHKTQQTVVRGEAPGPTGAEIKTPPPAKPPKGTPRTTIVVIAMAVVVLLVVASLGIYLIGKEDDDPTEPPSTPTLTVASVDNDGSFQVEWTGIPGADEYVLEEDDNSNFDSPTVVYSGPDNTVTLSGRSDGTYHYRVQSSNAKGSSGWSVVGSIDVYVVDANALPEPPVIDVEDTDDDGNFLVNWSWIPNADHYVLEQDDNPSFSSPLEIYNGTALSYGVSGLDSGVYYFRIRAVNHNGQGARGDTFSVTVDIPVAPTAPTITLDPTDNDGDYTVSWSAKANADSYTLEEAEDAAFTSPREVYSGPDLDAQISGKQDGTYHYRARAHNDVGTSDWSLAKSIIVFNILMETVTINGADFQFVNISSGTFSMGTDGTGTDEGPKHSVTITNSFHMGRFEITQKQWKAVMGENPSSAEGDDLPVEQVSWQDLQGFITAINNLDSQHNFRLPSEAEWEYCARAGSSSDYHFGDGSDGLGDYCWYSSNSERATHPVGQKLPNLWGLFDMYGNVNEWCQDDYHDSYNGAPTDGTAWGDGSAPFRVFRGGSSIDLSQHCRSAVRNGDTPDTRLAFLGLRLVMY